MGEQRFGTLAVRLAAENATAGRHSHHKRAGKLAIRPVAQPGGFGDDLVICWIHVIGELKLDAWPQTVSRHADGGADDAEFADRRIEAAMRAILRLQALRGAKH